MILADVNVLLYAFRRDAARHVECAQWLDGLVNGREVFGMSPQALAAVVRISTNPKIYPAPSSTADAVAYCDAILRSPNCRTILPGARHWRIFADLCAAVGAKGDLVTDAWFAALAIEHGCEWITTDRDFAVFPGLRWRAPEV